MRNATSLFSMLLAFAVLSGAASAAPAASDQKSKTLSGVTFTVPKMWSARSEASGIVLAAPENDLHVAVIDTPAAQDANAAVAQAWAIYRRDFHRPVKTVFPLPAREGWDERKSFDYEVSPNEHLVLAAVALRSGKRWTVGILEGSLSTAEKRGAGTELVFDSMRPGDYRRENFLGRTAHELDASRIEQLKSFMRTSMAELDIPGASIALADHGKVVFEDGFGVRELGKPDRVDANTLFMIASNTKGMSTLLLSELVDQGKLDWDEPVTKAYPSFRLGSDATTKKVLIRHLVCACTGLPRKDFDWIFNTSATTPATTTFAQLAETEPTSGFGEVFQYNNLMASAAGYVGAHIVDPNREVGAAYDDAMQKMVFDPLGMRETTFDFKRALGGDHASPHDRNIADGKLAVAAMGFNYAVRPYRPAGGAWSSAHDLIKYVENELRLGKLSDGTRLVSETNLLMRRKPNVPTGEDQFYGMGLETDATWGVTVVHHGGSLSGYKSDILFIPSADVGAVILTNADAGSFLTRPFMRRLLEILYDGKPEASGDVAAIAKNIELDMAAERKRLTIPAAPQIAASLARRYVNPDLGHISVLHAGKDTLFDFGLWKSRLATRKNDDGTVSFVTIDPTVEGFSFVVSSRAGKRSLILRDGQHEYVYSEGA